MSPPIGSSAPTLTHDDNLKRVGLFFFSSILRALKLLLKHHQDISVKDDRGQTLLHLAASLGLDDAIKTLLTTPGGKELLNVKERLHSRCGDGHISPFTTASSLSPWKYCCPTSICLLEFRPLACVGVTQ